MPSSVLVLAALSGCASGVRADGAAARSDGGATGADASACIDGDPDRESFGTDCLCCHTGQFSVAGSVAPNVARVLVTDSVGERFDIAVNPYGNFFRHAPLVPPLKASIVLADGGTRAMEGAAPSGACNACHGETATAARIGQ